MYVLIHQKYLLNTYYGLGKFVGDEDTAANKTKIPDLMNHIWLAEEVNKKKIQGTTDSIKC